MTTLLISSRNTSADKNADALRGILHALWSDFIPLEDCKDSNMDEIVQSIDTLILNILLSNEELSADLITALNDNLVLSVDLDKLERQASKLTFVDFDDSLGMATTEMMNNLSSMPGAESQTDINTFNKSVTLTISHDEMRILLRETISEWINNRLK